MVMLELTGANGKNVIVPIALNKIANSDNYAINIMTSVYTKDSKSLKWFTDRLETDQHGVPLYVNERKTTDWYVANRLQLPYDTYHISGFFKKSIPSEKDLVKLRNQNNNLYQGSQGSSVTARILGVAPTDMGKAKEKIKRTAKANAILFARHADKMAESISKATGEKYTAMDYFERFAFSFGSNGVDNQVTQKRLSRGGLLFCQTMLSFSRSKIALAQYLRRTRQICIRAEFFAHFWREREPAPKHI